MGETYRRCGGLFRVDGSFLRVLPFLALVFVPTHQLPIDIGDLLQVLFHPVIVLNPPADLLELILWHCATGPMRLVQSHAQIPYRPVPLAACAFAVGVATGQIAFHQRTAKHFSERGQKFG